MDRNSEEMPPLSIGELVSNNQTKKLLLRIPRKLAQRLKKKRGGKGSDKINSKIGRAVEKFLSEVVPEEFRRTYPQGLSPRELKFWAYRARKEGFFPSNESPTDKRVRFGTILPLRTLEQLKVIATWGGTSRQSAVDACIAYYFQIPGAPNPDRGQFANFTYPLLSGPDRLTRHRLRWLVEYANL